MLVSHDWLLGSGSTFPETLGKCVVTDWLLGSGSTFPEVDPDPPNDMDPTVSGSETLGKCVVTVEITG